MKVYRFDGTGHSMGPRKGSYYNRHDTIQRGDFVILIARVGRISYFLLPSGRVRYVTYDFLTNTDFVDISP